MGRAEGRGVLGFVTGAVLLVLVVPGWAAGPAPCPDGLSEAAGRYLRILNDEQAKIRVSTREDPVGIEGSVQFDVSNHSCHRGPGQAYRIYREPVCLEATESKVVPVRYPFDLFYRKALTEADLFEKAWKPGSDGLLLVRFEHDDDRWVPAGRREVLDLEGKGGGHPGPPPKP